MLYRLPAIVAVSVALLGADGVRAECPAWARATLATEALRVEEARRGMVRGDWSIYLEIVSALQTLPPDCLTTESGRATADSSPVPARPQSLPAGAAFTPPRSPD